MRRVALVGISTTGKSFLGEKLRDSGRLGEGVPLYDSDEWIAEQILGDTKKPGIARVFLRLGRDTATKETIPRFESAFLKEHAAKSEPAIYALGPWVGIRDGWHEFKKSVSVVWLRKSSVAILRGLKKRHEKIREELRCNFPDLANDPQFGCWDINVWLDGQLRPLPECEAIGKIDGLNRRMKTMYGMFPQIDVTAEDVTADMILETLRSARQSER